MKFVNFLKQYFPNEYEDYHREYILEKVKDEQSGKVAKVEQPDIVYTGSSPLKWISKISSLHHAHPARLYVDSRQIPTDKHYLLYYAPKFRGWTNRIIPDKFIYEEDEDRLVIPFFDKDGKCFAYQGRSLDPNNKVRYITITLDYSKPKLFGIERVNVNRRFYCVEGPIDSLFVDNCIAMAGSDVSRNEYTGHENCVMIYDNQPRNKEIVKKINREIENQRSVVIWPNDLDSKDINDLVIGGMSKNQLMQIIDRHTFSGLEAKMRFMQWKKV